MLDSDETRAVTTAKFVDDSWNRQTVAQDTSDSLLGATLSDTYVVERLLGEGGMGRVYLARHTRIAQKRVAVKVLHQEYAGNAPVLARFQREAEAAASVCHPNVVTVMDVARTPQGQPYLVCEYLEGRDLGEHLKVVGKLAPGEALHIARHICRGLAAAHESGVIHRDLKPQNIFLVGDLGAGVKARPAVKILDFGLSRFLDAAPNDQLTQSGVIMGTPSYMAPEQARANPVDQRADVYGVGAILYTILAGRPPFMEDSPHATILAVLHGEPPNLRALERSIPEALEAVVSRAIAREPKDRYPDATSLEHALDAFESKSMMIESLPPRLLLPPEPAARPRQESIARAEVENARLTLLWYVIAAVVLFVGAAAASVPGVELATGYTFNRVEIGLFLLAVAGTALTPALLWLGRRGTMILRNRPEVARLLTGLRSCVLTFVITFGLCRFVLELVDGSLVRLVGPRLAPLGASFAGWSLIVPLLALTAALGRTWLAALTTNVRPGWRRLLATWSAASLLLVVLGSILVAGLHWRDRVTESGGAVSGTHGRPRALKTPARRVGQREAYPGRQTEL